MRFENVLKVSQECCLYKSVIEHVLDEEMDGEAIFDAIGCQVGPDCLKDG